MVGYFSNWWKQPSVGTTPDLCELQIKLERSVANSEVWNQATERRYAKDRHVNTNEFDEMGEYRSKKRYMKKEE